MNAQWMEEYMMEEWPNDEGMKWMHDEVMNEWINAWLDGWNIKSDEEMK